MNNFLTNSNIAGEAFDFDKINIKVSEYTSSAYIVHISIDNKPAAKWSLEIPLNLDFIKTIQCNIPEKNITKEEFNCYRKLMQLAYTLSVYFVDVKNNLEGNALSKSAFTGYDFYEFAEELLKQLHAEIEKRERCSAANKL